MFQLLQAQFEMHFERQMQLVIPDVMNAAVGILEALHIVLHILDVLDADEFYQSLQTLQNVNESPSCRPWAPEVWIFS